MGDECGSHILTGPSYKGKGHDLNNNRWGVFGVNGKCVVAGTHPRNWDIGQESVVTIFHFQRIKILNPKNWQSATGKDDKGPALA